MSDDIYEEHILDHYEDPFHRGTCEGATHRHEDKNPLCGDVIEVQLRLDDEGRVLDAWFDGEGCIVSQSSASMLMEQIQGKKLEEIKDFSAAQMLDLYGAKLGPPRQKCCLLSWRVLQSALYSPLDDKQGGGSVGPDLGEES